MKEELYIATKEIIGYDQWIGRIWKAGKGQPELIATRHSPVTALCIHKGKLYDATRSAIRETLKNKDGDLENSDAVIVYNDIISCMYSCGDEILFGGHYNGMEFGVFKINPDKPASSNSSCRSIDDMLIAKRGLRHVLSICTHNGKLYDSAGDRIFSTLDDYEGKHPLVIRPDRIKSIASWNDQLYDSAGRAIYLTEENKILKIRENPIISLLASEGGLIDTTNEAVYRTLEDLLLIKKPLITAIIIG